MPTKTPPLDDVSDADLNVRRGELLLAIEDAGDDLEPRERTALERELTRIEDELDARRRSRERAEIAAVAREQRAREEKLAADQALIEEARDRLVTLGAERAEAAGAIDRAVAELLGAVDSWRAVGNAQREPARLLEIDVEYTSRRILAVWLSDQLYRAFGTRLFPAWDHDDRVRPFIAVDAPFSHVPTPRKDQP